MSEPMTAEEDAALEAVNDYLVAVSQFARSIAPKGLRVTIIASIDVDGARTVMTGLSNANCPRCHAERFADSQRHGKIGAPLPPLM